jgi:hypothetical protein
VSRLGKVVRGLVGLAIVIVLLVTVNAWLRDYKVASRAKAKRSSTATSSTVEATAVVPVQGETASILAEGLTLQSTAATGTKVMRPLRKGEALPLVGITASNWLQLKDKNGKLGFVPNDARTIRVEK